MHSSKYFATNLTRASNIKLWSRIFKSLKNIGKYFRQVRVNFFFLLTIINVAERTKIQISHYFVTKLKKNILNNDGSPSMKFSVFIFPSLQTTVFSVYHNIIIRLYLVASVLSPTLRWLTLNGVTDDGKNYLYFFFPGKVSWKGPSISKLGGNNFLFFFGHDKERTTDLPWFFFFFGLFYFFVS